jgi:hypothetical protein
MYGQLKTQKQQEIGNMKFEVGQSIFITYFGNKSVEMIITEISTAPTMDDYDRTIHNLTTLKCQNKKSGKFHTYTKWEHYDDWINIDGDNLSITSKRIPLKIKKNRNFVLYD